MISQLDLVSFKCFDRLKLPLGPLTLLSGVNGSGKSSVLHSLVFLHQASTDTGYGSQSETGRIKLKGKDIDFGSVVDLLDRTTGQNRFEIGVAGDGVKCWWTFSGGRNEMSLELRSAKINGKEYEDFPFLVGLFPIVKAIWPPRLRWLLGNLTFISAEREGPRDLYPLEDKHVGHDPKYVFGDNEGGSTIANARNYTFFGRVGVRGENTASVLFQGSDELVKEDLRLPEHSPTLLHQVGAWMNKFFPGCALEVQRVPNRNYVTLGMRMSEKTDFLRPFHSGFGLTQVLPIVVAALSIPEGNILLIENPEVHLHPAGQALMGQFLGEVAMSGIQVVVETHSDHVLNGIRRAVKSGRIPAKKVDLHFFRARSDGDPQVLSPMIDGDGNIDYWPTGFFDQFDKDISYFAGWDEL